MSNRDMKKLKIKVALVVIIAFIFLCLTFFLPAWSLKYWQGWVYIAELFIPMFFVMIYMLKKDPELLEKRMKMKERVKGQKRFIWLAWIFYLATFVVPGFDVRFGWSCMPLWVILLGEIIVFMGYVMTAGVILHNRYAS